MDTCFIPLTFLSQTAKNPLNEEVDLPVEKYVNLHKNLQLISPQIFKSVSMHHRSLPANVFIENNNPQIVYNI